MFFRPLPRLYNDNHGGSLFPRRPVLYIRLCLFSKVTTSMYLAFTREFHSFLAFFPPRNQRFVIISIEPDELCKSSHELFARKSLGTSKGPYFLYATPDHLLLDESPNIGPLISRWELDKFKNCWNKSFITSKILTLLYQQLSNLLISQRDVSGPKLGALSGKRSTFYRGTLYKGFTVFHDSSSILNHCNANLRGSSCFHWSIRLIYKSISNHPWLFFHKWRTLSWTVELPFPSASSKGGTACSSTCQKRCNARHHSARRNF